MTYHAHICACEHGHLSHQYQLTTRTNGGECLAPGCWCGEFSLQNPTGIED